MSTTTELKILLINRSEGEWSHSNLKYWQPSVILGAEGGISKKYQVQINSLVHFYLSLKSWKLNAIKLEWNIHREREVFLFV